MEMALTQRTMKEETRDLEQQEMEKKQKIEIHKK